MNRIGSFRVHADGYRFIILDSSADPHADMQEWTQEAQERGFIANGRVVHVRTCSRLQEHWADVLLADFLPDSPADRSFSAEIDVESGSLSVRDSANPPSTSFSVGLPAGRYAVLVLTRNLGGGERPASEDDPPDCRELTDDDLKYGPGVERYQIVLVRQD